MALMHVADALERILKNVRPLKMEKILLEEACSRVLALTSKARRTQPPFVASAMDGYAVRHGDITAAPVTLKLIGTSAAGHGFGGVVKPGTAVRILTGAPLPKGADTVVIQENTKVSNFNLNVLETATMGKNIRRAGLDFAKGDILVERGAKLSPRDIGVLAAGNHALVAVFQKPRVVIFTTGDELVLPGEKPKADQIFSSNSHALSAMLQQFGADVVNLGIVKDNLKATIKAVQKGFAADVLITTGGASVGDHDYVQAAFKACGVKIDFWKIALRPGKPFMYGRKGTTHVMGLPGNPVSALVTARIFLKPLLNLMSGLPVGEPDHQAVLQGVLPQNDNRQDYIRATLTIAADGQRIVTPFAMQDSSMQRVLQSSQALIVRPPIADAAQNGDVVSVLLLDF
jgi:molybdopterin molybdotransferase